jgi:hypothetical protein
LLLGFHPSRAAVDSLGATVSAGAELAGAVEALEGACVAAEPPQAVTTAMVAITLAIARAFSERLCVRSTFPLLNSS